MTEPVQDQCLVNSTVLFTGLNTSSFSLLFLRKGTDGEKKHGASMQILSF